MKEILTSHRNGIKILVSIFVLMLSAQLYGGSDSEIITAIILINRQAELVDMDDEGEIIHRHVAIPDYFSSGRSHQSSLRKSLSLIKDYGSIEKNFFLPGGSKLPAVCLQSYMLSFKNERIEEQILYSKTVKQEIDCRNKQFSSVLKSFRLNSTREIDKEYNTHRKESFFLQVYAPDKGENKKQRTKPYNRFYRGELVHLT